MLRPLAGAFLLCYIYTTLCVKGDEYSTKNHKKMKKEKYETPVAEALEVKIEGVICVSGGVNANMNGVFEEETI